MQAPREGVGPPRLCSARVPRIHVCARQVPRDFLRYAGRRERRCTRAFLLFEEAMGMDLRYCPQHERLYDDTECRWIPFVRGEVCLILAIYPREDALSFQEDICDWCVSVGHRLWVGQCEAQWSCCAPCLCQPTRHARVCSTHGCVRCIIHLSPWCKGHR
jgi:hypothetical protein